jgi:hypothetical protein
MTELITWLGWRDHFFLVLSLWCWVHQCKHLHRRPGAVRSRPYARREEESAVPHRRPVVDLCRGERLPGRIACLSKWRVKNPEWHEQF